MQTRGTLCRTLFLTTLLTLILATQALAQGGSVTGSLRDSISLEAIAGARIVLIDTGRSAPATKPRLGAISTNSGEFRIRNVPVGTYRMRVTRMGYDTAFSYVTMLPNSDSVRLSLALSRASGESQIVVVSGTRTERYIADVPVRIETVEQEDIEEKLMEKPASVVELLNESVGTRVQTTSGTSNAANIRIQGLDGRYTQILVDGLPSYSGLSSQFGITQLMPLNLRRVEIVKGASSALFGPDAIAGIVNFITKDPHTQPEINGLLNITSQKGYDASFYYGQQFDPIGLTTLVSYSGQRLFDVDHDGFSDIAQFNHATVAPKLCINLSDRVKAVVSGSYFSEHRRGGSMNATDATVGLAAPYVEDHQSRRLDLSSSIDWNIAEEQSGTIRGSMTQLNQDSHYGATPFNATQTLGYADVQYMLSESSHTLQFGSSFSNDRFEDRTPGLDRSRSYLNSDIGLWAQDEADLGSEWKALASARLDHSNGYGSFLIPRASIIFKPREEISIRLGVGTGFKVPTIFLEDAERIGFKNTFLRSDAVPEQAKSGSLDLAYRTVIDRIATSLACAFFVTSVDHALVMQTDSSPVVSIANVTGATVTKGVELSATFTLDELHLALNYAYLDVQQTDRGATYALELNPHNWLGASATYEEEESGIKTGVEAYYVGVAALDRNPFRTTTPAYWLLGALFEKAFGPVHLYVNSENLLDIRQSRYEPTYLGSPETGTFHPLPIYAPQEGRTFNAGILFKL